MKKTSMLGAAIFVGAAPLVASAQFDEDPNVDISARAMASYWNTDDLGDAWGGQFGIAWEPIEWLSAEIRSGYLRAEDEGLEIIPLEGLALFRVPNIEVVEPYGGVGVGHYFFSSDDISTSDTQAIFPVAGIEVQIGDSNMRLFGEARYMLFEENISSDVPSDLDGLGVSVGVSWRF